VRQDLLHGQQVVADLDDVLDGLLDALPDAVGGAADLIGKLRFEQVVVEADDDQLAFGLFGHGSLSRAGDGVAAEDGLPLLGLPRQLPPFRQSADGRACHNELRERAYGSCPVLPFWSRLVAAGTAAASTVELVPGAVVPAWLSRGTGKREGGGVRGGNWGRWSRPDDFPARRDVGLRFLDLRFCGFADLQNYGRLGPCSWRCLSRAMRS